MKFFKKHRVKIIGLLLIIAILTPSLPPVKTFYQTILVGSQFVPFLPQKIISLPTIKPIIKEVTFTSGQKQIYADLWLPKAKNKEIPAVILHLGVDIDRKNRDVQKLTQALSRSGIAVLVPNIPSLSNRRVGPEAKEDFIASFEFLRSQPQIKKEKVGFLSFCASAGLVLKATEDERIRNDVSFAIVGNPYFDFISTFYEPFATGNQKINKEEIPWHPNFKTVEIYNRQTILLLSKKDQEILFPKLVSVPKENLESRNFPTLSDFEKNSLSKDGLFIYDFLTNKDPEKVGYFIENLPQNQKDFVAQISPSTNLDSLNANLFIWADINNPYIPSSESQRLSEEFSKKHTFIQTKILKVQNYQNPKINDYFLGVSQLFILIFKSLSFIKS